MTVDSLLQFLGFLAAIIIFWRAEIVLNLMTAGCRLLIRLAFWMLAVGALIFTWRVSQGYVPPFAFVLSLAGTALLLISERRVRALLRTRPAKSISPERRLES